MRSRRAKQATYNLDQLEFEAFGDAPALHTDSILDVDEGGPRPQLKTRKFAVQRNARGVKANSSPVEGPPQHRKSSRLPASKPDYRYRNSLGRMARLLVVHKRGKLEPYIPLQRYPCLAPNVDVGALERTFSLRCLGM
jgi:hypothetical protein